MDHENTAPGEIERSPAHTLDQVADGARQLLLISRERLRDIETSLEEGRFSEAFARTQELMGKLQPLAQAETYIGGFASTFIVRAADVHEGMVLHTFGTVTSTERREHNNPGGEPCVHIKLACEHADDLLDFQADAELIALRSE